MFLRKIVMMVRQWVRRKRDKKKAIPAGNYFHKYMGMNKSAIIKQMVKVAGLINGAMPRIQGSFRDELRGKSKRELIRALIMLELSYNVKKYGRMVNEN